MPLGQSNGVAYAWFNVGDTLTISNLASSTWTGLLYLTLQRWDGPSASPVASGNVQLTITSGVVTTTTITPATLESLTVGAHYALFAASVVYTSGSNNGVNLTATLTVTPATMWQIIHMGDLDPIGGDPIMGSDTRMDGFSFLATNTTSFLNRQGTVLAARMKNIEFSQQTPATLARVAEKYTGDADKGVYTYLEFSSTRERFTIATPDGFPFYPLDGDDYYHMIQITCPNVATTANTYTCSFDSTLEFKTDSARYVKGVSPWQFGALVEARRLCNSSPEWFYENPLHWRDIIMRIGRGASMAYRAAKTYGPGVLGTAARVYPGSSTALLAAGSLLRALQ
jgi:hypothetical protein